jgi:hypothetical protein
MIMNSFAAEEEALLVVAKLMVAAARTPQRRGRARIGLPRNSESVRNV